MCDKSFRNVQLKQLKDLAEMDNDSYTKCKKSMLDKCIGELEQGAAGVGCDIQARLLDRMREDYLNQKKKSNK